ncbi:conserved Plasmodium protein, unknown function [Plasmodium malariae]|uniref:Uncharacterized protein n=1 Tax=Plasmodium malariae TaxID=5858 RepID=A0A1C3K9L6_PLAMA|nr:conserved Plasmodium protein, unknown function [Plasmodium malariae]
MYMVKCFSSINENAAFINNKDIERSDNNNNNRSINSNSNNTNSSNSKDSVDYNSTQIIEKYQHLLKRKKIKGGKEDPKYGYKERDMCEEVGNKGTKISPRKINDCEGGNKTNVGSANKCVLLNEESDKSGSSIRSSSGSSLLTSGKDEKYVILKKQITKEFIYEVFLPHVESQIIYHLKTYTPDQIVNIFHIYSYLYYYDKKKEMVDQLIEYLIYRLDCFSVENVLLVLEPLYILNKNRNMYIYRLIINYIEKIKEKLNIYNYIGISRVYTKVLIDLYLEEINRANFFLSDILQYLRQGKFRKSIPSNQRNISHKDFIIHFMIQVIEKVDEELHLLSAIELTDILSVISNYSFKNNYSKYDISLQVNNRKDVYSMHHTPSENYSNDCNSVEVLQVHDLSPTNAYLFKENIVSFIIIKEMVKKYEHLSTLHKIINFYNLSKLCIYDDEFIHLMENDLNNYHYVNNIHHKYLALLIWCLHKYKILHKHIEKLKPIIIQNIFNFNAKGFSRLCHAIYYEKEILHKIAINLMNKIEKMNINEFLCYFYSVILLDLLPLSLSSRVPFRNGKEKCSHDHTPTLSEQQSELAKKKWSKRKQIGKKQSEMNQSEMNQSEMNQSEMNQSEMNQSEMNQSEMNQSEMNQSEIRQSEKIIPDHLVLLNKSRILQNCIKFINDNKKDISKEEMTKIVLLLKKKKHEKYLYVLGMLPEEWKTLIHLIN